MLFLRDLLEEHAVRGGVAEIGVLEGRGSTPILLDHVLRHGGTLDSVDLFTEPETHARIRALLDHPGMRTHAGYSVEVGLRFDRKLAFLFVDGDHGFPRETPAGKQSGVALDILAWHPHLEVGGILVFHDYTGTDEEYGEPGMMAVEHAVDGLCREPLYAPLGAKGRFRAFRKLREGVPYPQWSGRKRLPPELARAWDRLAAEERRLREGVVIYGTGESAWNVLRCLRRNCGSDTPVRFTDSFTREPGESWEGVPLLPLEACPPGWPLVIGSLFEEPIRRTLAERGLRHLEDFFGLYEFLTWWHMGRVAYGG